MKYLSYSLSFLTILAFVGCSSPTSSSGSSGTSGTSNYTNKVLPKTLSVSTPSSLSSSSSASASANLRMAETGRDAAGGGQSEGYGEITSMTSMMKSMLPISVMFGVIVDAAISQNSLSPGTDTKNVKVTLTQAMYNTIAAQLPSGAATSVQQEIGTSITLSDVNYAATGTGTLPNSVSITEGTGTSSQTITYKWSTTSVLMSMTMSGMTLEVACDGADGSGAFELDTGTTGLGTFKMSVAPDSKSTTSGASVSMTVGTFSIYGYADNSGGIVYTNISSTPAATWEEGFDSTGTLVFQDTGSSVSTLASSYTSTTAAITEAACLSSYGTSAAAASTLSDGALSLL